MLRFAAWCGWIVGFASLTGCGATLVHATDELSLRAPWEGYGTLLVQTRNGSIDMAAADVKEIEIAVTRRAGGLTLGEAQENVKKVRIVAERDRKSPDCFVIRVDAPEALRNKSVGASFTIRVPQACGVDARTSNGSIGLARLGPVAASTSNGRIQLEDISGTVQADSSNGSIVAVRVHGSLQAQTSNGSVHLTRVQGDCRVETSNGRIEVEEADGLLELETSNGGIELHCAAGPQNLDATLRSSNAGIAIVLPSDARAAIELNTSNGRVTTNIQAGTLTAQSFSSTSFEGELNGGGGRVRATASNGSITLTVKKS